jgi:hypothetical protein
MKRRVTALVVVVDTALIGSGSALAHSPDALVTVGSPTTPFSQNKQNEPTIATDANIAPRRSVIRTSSAGHIRTRPRRR